MIPLKALYSDCLGARHLREYDENGIDLTSIRENLKLTPEQRVRRGEERARRLPERIAHIERRLDAVMGPVA